MAQNRQGISGFLPFPTFQGGEGTGGITQVKLNATPMRFPTTNYRARRQTPEPTTKETLAPFAPLALEGLFGLFSDDDEKLSSADYLASIGGMVEEPTTLAEVQNNQRQKARLDTYELYGDAQEKDGFGLSEIANMVVGSQMGRGADNYANTYFDIRNAKEKSRLSQNANRTAFLASQLKDVDNLTYKVFEDAEAATLGVSDRRSGYSDPRGNAYVMNDDKTGYINIMEQKGNWIEQKSVSNKTLANQLKNPFLTDLLEKDADINAKDTALIGTATLANEVLMVLDKGIKDPKQNALTTVTSIGNVLNSAKSNFEQIGSFIGGGDVMNAFATAQDVQAGTAGSNGREGTGELSKQLYTAIQSGDDDQMKAAMAAFEQSGALGLGTDGNPQSFSNLLGDMAYNDVRTRAVMLQLAYSAAAANGQTGRTLSDKDLAFHLQMVGFGATQDGQTAKDNLLSFMDTLIRQTDNTIQGSISQNAMGTGQYDLTNDLFTSVINGYWEPPKVNGKLDFSDPNKYTFKDFRTRYSKIPDVMKFFTHKRRAGTTFTGGAESAGTVNTRQLAEDDIKAIEAMSK